MSMIPDSRKPFPYSDIYSIYLKCGKDERLKNIFFRIMNLIYPECVDFILPIDNDGILNQRFTYGVQVLTNESFQSAYSKDEVYPWHLNPVAIIVPYGNHPYWPVASTDWRVHVARTLRCVMHAARIIPNDTPMLRQSVNLAIPWIPIGKKPSDYTDVELYDYAEIVLSVVSGYVFPPIPRSPR